MSFESFQSPTPERNRDILSLEGVEDEVIDALRAKAEQYSVRQRSISDELLSQGKDPTKEPRYKDAEYKEFVATELLKNQSLDIETASKQLGENVEMFLLVNAFHVIANYIHRDGEGNFGGSGFNEVDK